LSTERGNKREKRSRDNQEKDNEFIEHVVKIYRVAKVVKGGRRFSFSAIVVVGDGKGRVGAAMGKATEVPNAIRKAIERARANMIKVPVVNTTVPHEVQGRSDSAVVLMKPASLGTGIVAGGAVRAVVEAAGYENILTKSLGSNNATNVVWASIEGLKRLKTAEQIASLRGLDVAEIL
jgi:small subunit ribosomal protein S5